MKTAVIRLLFNKGGTAMKKLLGFFAMMLALVACNSMEIDNQPVNSGIDDGDGITITARLAPLSSSTKAVSDPGNGTIHATWQQGETIAILYRANGEPKVAVAAITDVDAGGTATISFKVVSGTTDNTPCTLVYPYSAARADGLGIKDYSALFSTQNGLLVSDMDVREGAGTIQISQPGLMVTTQPVPWYAIFKFTLKKKDSNDNISARSFTVRNAANEVITTVSPSEATSSLYVALPAAASGTVYKFVSEDNSQSYRKILSLTKDTHAGYCYTTTLDMDAIITVDLSKLSGAFTAQDGYILTGELKNDVWIAIRHGAAVTLAGVTINGTNNHEHYHAGIICRGDATLILKDGTENIVKGFDSEFPGISVPSGSTLAIQGEIAGTGRLVASSNGYGAGIGGSSALTCGNIVIEGGSIEAAGGDGCAGIGSGEGSSCGDITIRGGTILATGGEGGAGIGSGSADNYMAICGAITITGGNVTAIGGAGGAGIGTGNAINGGNNICGNMNLSGGVVMATGGTSGAGIGTGSHDNAGSNTCGAITITNTVARVGATKGSNAPYSVGAGTNGTCGTITIGGKEVNPISTSPYRFQPSIPGTLLKGEFSVSGTKRVYFSQGNLQATYDGVAWSWAFAEHQWDFIGGRQERGSEPLTGNNLINGHGTVSGPGTIDLFGWVGNSSTALTGYPARYGISNSKYYWDYGEDFYDLHLRSDWGNLLITNGGGIENVGWRTLSRDEWLWMLGPDRNPDPGKNCRTSSTVNGTANARFATATINPAGTPVTGLIIFPDNYEGGTPAGVTWGPINIGGNQYATTCTSAGWAALENAGCVFLPAAGSRSGNNVSFLGYGEYWTSTGESNGYAYVLEFHRSMLEVSPSMIIRHVGASVRVVRNAN